MLATSYRAQQSTRIAIGARIHDFPTGSIGPESLMTEIGILTTLGALLIGLILGTALGRILARRAGPHLRLSDQLRTRDQRLQLYERQVVEHFERTALLTAELDRSLDQLRDHLAAGASTLAGEEIGNRIAQGACAGRGAGPNLQPPRDYAPNRTPSGGEPNGSKDDVANRGSQLQLVGEDDDPTYKVG